MSTSTKLVLVFLALVIATLMKWASINQEPNSLNEVKKETKEEISESPEIPVVLQKIAQCESEGKQFNEDGTVVRGIQNSLDTGKYQINLFYHQTKAEELGFDLFTEEGNEEYALWLYKTEGTKPWNWSKECWSKLDENPHIQTVQKEKA